MATTKIANPVATTETKVDLTIGLLPGTSFLAVVSDVFGLRFDPGNAVPIALGRHIDKATGTCIGFSVEIANVGLSFLRDDVMPLPSGRTGDDTIEVQLLGGQSCCDRWIVLGRFVLPNGCPCVATAYIEDVNGEIAISDPDKVRLIAAMLVLLHDLLALGYLPDLGDEVR
jgi:hypothetical protein